MHPALITLAVLAAGSAAVITVVRLKPIRRRIPTGPPPRRQQQPAAVQPGTPPSGPAGASSAN